MDDSREKALNAGANMSTGGTNFNYCDADKLERKGLVKYNTKKPNGDNFIRVVAPSDTGPFAAEIWHHSKVGSSKATYLCMEKMYGKPCAVCDYQKDMKAAGVKVETIKELNPAHRFFMYVVDTTSGDSEDEGPKWFDCPVSIYKNICTLSKDRRTGESFDPTDPINGRDIEFVRKDGNRTEYTGMKLVPTKPIPESWYADLPAFEEVLLTPDYDAVKVAVSGQQKESVEDTKGGRRDEVTNDRGGRRDSGRGRGRDDRDVVEEEDTSRTRRDSRRDENRGTENNVGQEESVQAKLDEIKKRKRQANSE